VSHTILAYSSDIGTPRGETYGLDDRSGTRSVALNKSGSGWLQPLEEENRKLEQLVADLTLDKVMLPRSRADVRGTVMCSYSLVP